MERLALLGVEVDCINIAELHDRIREAVHTGSRVLITGHNLHSVALYHRDAKRRQFFRRADIIRIDGMPLVFWGTLLGHTIGRDRRVTWVDWIGPLMAEAARCSWRVFFLGGKPGVGETAACHLRLAEPALQIRTHHGYFPDADSRRVIEQIDAYAPHLLLVGMGMPRQEHWLLDNLSEIRPPAVLTVGACFDYVAGVIPTPPRWMGRAGLEWLYRLISDPVRMWRRYLVEPWPLVPFALRDITHRRRGLPSRDAPSSGPDRYDGDA